MKLRESPIYTYLYKVLRTYRGIIYAIYLIMKTTCPSGYHQNRFVVTYALWHMIYGYTLLVHITMPKLKGGAMQVNQ